MNNEPNQQEQQAPQEPIENIIPTSDEPVVEQIITEPEITNPQPENKEMEVHHHAHHGHEKKTWKSYFWEFFMLFLAVFCGSIAELQLEHYIEYKREIKLVEQLLLDLKSDERKMNDFISQQEIREKRSDSLFELIRNKEFAAKGNEIYFFARSISRYGNYIPTDGTITQLKFGGNLRLIKQDEIVTRILDYDSETRVLTDFIGKSFEENKNYRAISEEIFDAKIFYDLVDNNNLVIRPTNNPQMLDTDPKNINILMMRLQYMIWGSKRAYNLAKRVLEKEVELKNSLENAYHLK